MIETVIAKLLDPISTPTLRIREYAVDEPLRDDPPAAGTKVVDMTGKRGALTTYPRPKSDSTFT